MLTGRDAPAQAQVLCKVLPAPSHPSHLKLPCDSPAEAVALRRALASQALLQKAVRSFIESALLDLQFTPGLTEVCPCTSAAWCRGS